MVFNPKHHFFVLKTGQGGETIRKMPQNCPVCLSLFTRKELESTFYVLRCCDQNTKGVG